MTKAFGFMIEIGREELIELLRRKPEDDAEPVVIGISGYGGAGKSTIAKELGEAIVGAIVIGVDEYYVIEKNVPDNDWGTFDRDKFRAEIERRVQSNEFKIVICEGVGIFHPDTVQCFSIRIWVETDLETATLRGMKRERYESGFELDDVWREIWEPNERRFEAKHNPKAKAHFSVRN